MIDFAAKSAFYASNTDDVEIASSGLSAVAEYLPSMDATTARKILLTRMLIDAADMRIKMKL